MRVNEILVENKKHLNEVAPLIGGVGVGAAMAAISAIIAGWTVVELIQFVSKYNEDPEKVTDEEWGNLLFDILLIAVPGLAGKAIKRLIPNSLKIRLSNWLKNKILTRYRELNRAKADKAIRNAGGGAAVPREVRTIRAKERLANMKARAKADKLVASMPSKLKTAFVSGIGLNIAHDYYTKISDLDEDWEKYQNGDRATKTFGNATEAEAREIYNREKNKFWGEFITIASTAMATLPTARAVSLVGSTLGKLTGGGFVGGLVQVPFAAAASLIKIAGFSLAMFTQTQSGQQLLANTLGTAMQIIGGTATFLGELAQKAAMEIAEKLGVKLELQPIKKKEPEDEIQSKLSNKEYIDYLKKNPEELRRTVNNTNPKIIYIGGVQVTDQNGFQSVPDSYLNDLRQRAKSINVQDPTVGITKKV